MLLAVLLPAGEAEADAAEVMRCSTGRHLCGANRPAVKRGTYQTAPCPEGCHAQDSLVILTVSLDARHAHGSDRGCYGAGIYRLPHAEIVDVY